MRRTVRTIVLVGLCGLTSVVGVAACGGDDNSVSSGRSGGNPAAAAGDPTKPASYEGLSKSAAIAKAEAADVTWRITREDDESFMVTLDYNPDRVNFEIDDGRVTTASFG